MRALVQRHEGLRTRIGSSGEEQIATASQDVAFRELDLSRSSEAERDRELSAFHDQDATDLFDLENGPLVRFALIKFTQTHYRVVITAHHIVCDGWSMGILVRDLGSLYEEGAPAESTAASDVPLFSDFAHDQKQRHDGSSGAEALAYWLKQFQGDVPVLELPTDRERPAMKTYAGGQLGLRFELSFLNRLKEYAAQNGATVFSTLLAAYSVFLKRLSNCDDVVLGVGTAGQPAAGARDLVGHCVTLYPLRSRATRQKPFAEHLAEIKNGLVDSLDYADCTYGTLIKELALPRHPGRLPLLSTMVTYETETIGLSFEPLKMAVRNNAKRYCNFDIELYLTESNDGLLVEFHFNRDLFDDSTINRWLADFQVLLGAILEHEDAAVDQLEWLCEDERRLLDSWNATGAEYARDKSIHALFEAQVAERQGASAVLLPASSEREPLELSYAELNARSNQLARHLRRMCATPGEPVAGLRQPVGTPTRCALGSSQSGARLCTPRSNVSKAASRIHAGR